MSMDLEDRLSATLHRLADGVAAPPTPTAKDGVGHRAGQLHRRRQIGRTLGSVVLVAAVIGGGAVVLNDPGQPVEVQPSQEGPAGNIVPLPMFTIDGLTTTKAEHIPEPEEVAGQTQPLTGQTFFQTGKHVGPALWMAVYDRCFDAATLADLESTVAQDVLACWGEQYSGITEPAAGVDVTIDGAPGRIWPRGGENSLVVWIIGDDSAGVIQARALTNDDLVAFANGLVLRPDGRSWEATVFPQDISEQNPGDVAIEAEYQLHVLEDSTGGRFEIGVHRGGASEFQQGAGTVLNADAVEEIEVLGRPAIMQTRNIDYDGTPRVSISWRHTDDVIVGISMPATDRAGVDAILARLHEMDPAAWQQIVQTVPWPGTP